MKKICASIFIGLLASQAYADTDNQLVLDQIQFQLTSKQWVKTEQAKLQISINATLSNTDLVKARNDIMTNLTKIAKGEWHITQFIRSQDSSGLEKLYVEAQARVPQQALTTVNVQAKAVSKPGATYKVANIDFTPSLTETQKVKEQVRADLYKRINTEIESLNKQYPQQKFSVHSVQFVDGNAPMPRPTYKAREMNTMALAAQAPGLSVSNNIQMTALVKVASNRIAD